MHSSLLSHPIGIKGGVGGICGLGVGGSRGLSVGGIPIGDAGVLAGSPIGIIDSLAGSG